MKFLSHALFVFGTLLEEQAQKTVLGKAYMAVTDTLSEFIKKEKAVPGSYPGLGLLPAENRNHEQG
jgi:hypothetical protein